MTVEPSGLDKIFFSGRDNEIARLAQCLQDCLNARGRTVFVTGEAGIGKTRLAHEVIDRAKKLGFRVLEGQCLPGSSSPYLPFEDALRGFFRIAKGDSDATAGGKISKAFKGEAPELRESVQAVELLLRSGSVVASQERQLGLRAWLRGQKSEKELGLKEWLKGPKPEAYQEFVADVSRAELVKDRFLQIVSSMIVEIAKIEPVLLFIDDLQWADSSSLALLHFLSRRFKTAKALIIAAYRSEDLTGSINLQETLQVLSREDLSIKIELKPLEKIAYSEILQQSFQSHFGHQFLDRLYEDTEGNPLFALETLRLLSDEGAIKKTDGEWKLSLPISKLRIPDKVKDVLDRRVERLNEQDRRILELASVIGDEFESSAIQNILALERLQLLQLLSAIERTHSLIQSGESGYRFTHSKVREVIYDRLTPELRREYHSLVAEWMEKKYSDPQRQDEVAIVLAQHFFQGQAWKKALTYFAIAGDFAMQIHAHPEALQAYTHALEAYNFGKSVLPAEIGSSLHERSALAALAAGKIDDALRAFDSLAEAAHNAGDERWYGKAKLMHGWASFWNKDLETALQDCSEALTVGRRVEDKTIEARSLYLTGTSLLAKGFRQEAKAHLDDSLRISRMAGDRVTETQALLVLLMEGLSK